MPVSFHTVSTESVDLGGSTASYNFVINPPSGLVSGDLWVVTVNTDLDDHDVTSPVIGVPSGWTAISGERGYLTANPDSWPFFRSMWKIAGASEGAVTVVLAGGVAKYPVRAISKRYSGVNAASPIGNVVNGTENAGGSGTQNYVPGSITVQNDGSMVDLINVHYVNNGATATTLNEPTGTTLIHELSTGWLGHINAYQARNTGVYTPSNFQAGHTSESTINLHGQMFEIIPGSGFIPRALLLGVG